MTAKRRKPPLAEENEIVERPAPVRPNEGAKITSIAQDFLANLRGPYQKKTRKERSADESSWGGDD